MEEAEALDAGGADAKDDVKKSAIAATTAAGGGGGRRALQLSTQLLSQLAPGAPGLEDVGGLRVEDMPDSPIQAQLSPTGLISIAAADIDEAAPRLPTTAAFDWEVVEALRRSGRDERGDDAPDVAETRGRRLCVVLQGACLQHVPHTVTVWCRTSIFEDALAQVIAPLPPQPAPLQSEGEQEAQSQLRFLSLLRRINELRSQQVDVRRRMCGCSLLSSRY